MSEYRRISAQQELGRRHPWTTLYGHWWAYAAVLAGFAVGGRWLWLHVHMHSSWLWVPLGVVGAVVVLPWLAGVARRVTRGY